MLFVLLGLGMAICLSIAFIGAGITFLWFEYVWDYRKKISKFGLGFLIIGAWGLYEVIVNSPVAVHVVVR